MFEALTTSDNITVISFGGVVLAALSGVVSMLWKRGNNQAEKNEKHLIALAAATREDLKKCEEGHTETNAKLTELSVKVGKLEGRKEALDELTSKIFVKIEECHSSNHSSNETG